MMKADATRESTHGGGGWTCPDCGEWVRSGQSSLLHHSGGTRHRCCDPRGGRCAEGTPMTDGAPKACGDPVERARALLAAATPGPWEWWGDELRALLELDAPIVGEPMVDGFGEPAW